MSFTFDSTIGGSSSNSFVSVSDASDYLTGRLDVAEWTAAATATQQYALVMATARLNTEEYVGVAVTNTQALRFPRNYVWNVSGLDYEDETAIPARIKQATCELALVLLKDTSWLADTGLEGFQNVQIGALNVTPRTDRRANALPAHVARLLSGLRVGGSSVPVSRG